MLKTMLITGANRGIGLEFVRQFAEDQWQVIACCRQPDQAKELQALAASELAEMKSMEGLLIEWGVGKRKKFQFSPL